MPWRSTVDTQLTELQTLTAICAHGTKLQRLNL